MIKIINGKPLIYVDMDSTIFDYISAFEEAYFKATGEKISVTENQCSKYHFHEIFGLSEEERYKYLNEDFFENMKPYEGMVEVINDFWDDFEFRFVTHIVVPNRDTYYGKIKSLRKHFPKFIDDTHMITMREKWLLYPSIIIDDNPEVLRKCYEEEFVTVKPIHFWNKDVKAVFEFNTSLYLRKLFNEFKVLTRFDK